MRNLIQESLLKNLKYALIGIFLGGLLSIATTSTTEKGNFQINYPSLFSSAAAGFITGFLFSLLQAYEEGLSDRQAKLEELQAKLQSIEGSIQSKVNSLDTLITKHENKLLENYDILERAKNSLNHYIALQNLLGSNKTERELIKSFLDRVVNQPNYITRSSIVDFYKLLTLGLQKCTIWRGIHQGSIRNLGFTPLDEAGETYFEILRNHHIQDKKRIIILTQVEQEDLKRKDIMLAFWEKTGKDVPSYWISQESFYRFTRLALNVEVHDCALHNEKVLLHYHRNYHRISDPNVPEGLIMIDFAGSRSAVWRAVTSIFTELDNPSLAIRFNQITKQDIDILPDD